MIDQVTEPLGDSSAPSAIKAGLSKFFVTLGRR